MENQDDILQDFLISGKATMKEDAGLHDAEEPCVKCFRCTNGLSTIEVMLYGNRCTFCAEDKPFSFLKILFICFYEIQIYNLIREIKRITPDYDDARAYYLAALGNLGYINIIAIKKNVDRLKLIFKLKKMIRIARKEHGENTKIQKAVEKQL